MTSDFVTLSACVELDRKLSNESGLPFHVSGDYSYLGAHLYQGLDFHNYAKRLKSAKKFVKSHNLTKRSDYYQDHHRSKRQACIHGEHRCQARYAALPAIGCTGSFQVDNDRNPLDLDSIMKSAYSYSSRLAPDWKSSASLPIHQVCKDLGYEEPVNVVAFDWSSVQVRSFQGFCWYCPVCGPFCTPSFVVYGLRMMCIEEGRGPLPIFAFWHYEDFRLWWKDTNSYITIRRPLYDDTWSWTVITYDMMCSSRSSTILTSDCITSACIEWPL